MTPRTLHTSWSRTGSAAVALCAFVAGGCVPGRVRAVETATAAPATAAAPASGRYAQAGTELTARLERSLSTDESYPTEPFTARVIAPVYGPHGELVVRAGAQLRGHVADADPGRHPRLELAFDSVDTVAGPATIAARVRSVARYPFRARGSMADDPPRAFPWSRPVGHTTMAFRVSPQGPLHLVLTRPLVAPGASAAAQSPP